MCHVMGTSGDIVLQVGKVFALFYFEENERFWCDRDAAKGSSLVCVIGEGLTKGGISK